MTYLLHCLFCDIVFEDAEFNDKKNCPLCGYRLIEKEASYPTDERKETEEDENQPLRFR